jgi:Glycosyl transferases group 1
MAKPRILYFNRDNPNPSGGVRTIYAHVQHLREHGFPAYVVHGKPDFKVRWFDHDVPTLFYLGGFTFDPDDVVIVPEDHRIILDTLQSVAVRKIVFCQNHFRAFSGLGQHRSWQEMGMERVFASSEIIAGFLSTYLGWKDVPVVHYALDLEQFKPQPKKLQIAYMPRKRPLEADFLCNFSTRLPGSLAGVPWISIDGMNEAAAANVLAESAIFLSLSCLEGFGLPPLEAMACGCAVVGYHGFGGLEYITRENGFWCEEGNPFACAQMLQQAVQRVLEDSVVIKRVVDSAIATAARYTADRQRQELLEFIKSV